MTESFQCSYRLTRQDIGRWAVVQLLHHRVLLGMSLLTSAWLAWVSRGHPASVSAAVVAGAIAFILTWIAYLLIIPPLLILQTPASRRVDVRIDIDPSLLRSESVHGRSEFRWSLITRIRRGPGATYLCLGPSQAVIIPDRALSDPGAVRAFVRFCRQQVAANRPPS